MAPTERKGKKAAPKPHARTSTPNATPGADSAEKTKRKRTGQTAARSSSGSSKRPPPTEDDQASSSVAISKRRKKTQTPRASSSIALDIDRDLESLASERSSFSEEPEFILAEITTVDGPKNRIVDAKSADPRVDYKLVTTLLHEVSFKKKKTRITKDGVKMFAKYIESFANEAISRSLEEKRAASNAEGMDVSVANRSETGHKKYLETEDLERAYPQLMLDF
ncbi:hypothetical protein FQN49_004177 [Arthroderma sp. PD_2]|nr:hypothetical protein FQN49_004177 [Arthroderma sp. PD_2]